ncbi:MAG: FAD-dependent oxidoreductase [candidate division WOR-3 bacterium]|nr:FAD-dependent oxidoreductase [candidate division WOR-3 bacterium]
MIKINLDNLQETIKRQTIEPDEDFLYDVIIIGGGPAGMTACVYAARKKLNVLLITKNLGGQVLWTSGIENYMGYQYITGQELAQKFSEQVYSFPIAIQMPDEVIQVERKNKYFIVYTKYGSTFQARALIIASGKEPKQLGIPNEKELTGRGVSYCATCDAPLYHNKTTAVIGGGNSAVLAALELSKIARLVYLIVRSSIKADPVLTDRLNQTPRIKVYLGYVPKSIKGKEHVESLIITKTDGSGEQELLTDGIFIEAGLVPNTKFLSGLVKTNEKEEIIVNCNCETSEPGVFACGDVTNVIDKQIIIACGEGAKAALTLYRYLMSTKI